MACALVSGMALNVHTPDFSSCVNEVKAVGYDNEQLEEYAEKVALLVNKERNAHGLPPVRISPLLSESANVRAREIEKSFSHTRPDGKSCYTAMSELGIRYSSAAENIAYGQKNPESVMNSWMNSAGHRANILNEKMEYIGVGVFYKNGVYYWSQFFAVSDNLADGAYLPDEKEDNVISSVTTTATQPTTTTTTEPVTTDVITTNATEISIPLNPITTTITTQIADEGQIPEFPVYDFDKTCDFSDIIRKIFILYKKIS
ncbi:MAG: hypothetical protein K2G36_10265 [Ruminococcus sp.]|nr:hypothetical protein [Ruminococcus sp.]